MSNPVRIHQSSRGPFLLDEEPQAWARPRERIGSPRDCSVVLARALRELRAAHAVTAVLPAIEDIVARVLGAESFALLERHDDRWRAVIAHGIADDDVSRMTGTLRGPSYPALAWCPLRAGQEIPGWLAIYRLAPTRRSLDAADFELIDALGPFIAGAILEAGAPARRPASVTRLRAM